MTDPLQPLLDARGLSKLFGGVVALDKLDLQVFATDREGREGQHLQVSPEQLEGLEPPLAL